MTVEDRVDFGDRDVPESFTGSKTRLTVDKLLKAANSLEASDMRVKQPGLHGLSDQFACSESQQLCQRVGNVFFWLWKDCYGKLSRGVSSPV